MIPGSVPPLFLDMQDEGEFELDGAMTYLSQMIGTDYAERFTAEVGHVLRETCQRVADEIAENGAPFDRRPDEQRGVAPIFATGIPRGCIRSENADAAQ